MQCYFVRVLIAVLQLALHCVECPAFECVWHVCDLILWCDVTTHLHTCCCCSAACNICQHPPIRMLYISWWMMKTENKAVCFCLRTDERYVTVVESTSVCFWLCGVPPVYCTGWSEKYAAKLHNFITVADIERFAKYFHDDRLNVCKFAMKWLSLHFKY